MSCKEKRDLGDRRWWLRLQLRLVAMLSPRLWLSWSWGKCQASQGPIPKWVFVLEVTILSLTIL